MQFPEDFPKFEKLSPRFGEVKDDVDFWLSLLTTVCSENAQEYQENSRTDPDLSIATFVAWGGLVHAMRNNPQYREDIRYASILPNVEGIQLPVWDKKAIRFVAASIASAYHPEQEEWRQKIEEFGKKYQMHLFLGRRADLLGKIKSSTLLDQELDNFVNVYLEVTGFAKSNPGVIPNSLEIDINSSLAQPE